MNSVFFGHRDCPDSLRPRLLEIIKAQIKRGVLRFYVGNHGNFDRMALSCLRELKRIYPEISYAVVLAYLPTNPTVYQPNETVLPEEIESVPRRYAIDFRNRWMINHADLVVAYVTRSFGGAAKYVKKAENKGATIINLANTESHL